MKDFYEMTKPVKHRWIKMLKQYISDLVESAVNSVNYKYCNILSKLHIYKREIYKDSFSKVHPFPVQKMLIGDNDFKVTLSAVYNVYTDIYRDYFKDTKGKIVFILKDETRNYLEANFFVDDVYVKVGESYHLIASGIPYFKTIEHLNPPQASRFEFVEPTIHTVTLDVTKIRSLSLAVMLGAERSVESVSEAESTYHYECACDKMREYINNITKKDLEV